MSEQDISPRNSPNRIARELAAAQALLDSGPDDPLWALAWWMDWHAEAELREESA